MTGYLKKALLFVVVPVAAIAAAALFWLSGARYVSTENAYVKTDIAKVAAEVSGRALKVHVHAHEVVKKGDVLVTLDPEPFRIALARARAELDAARQEIRTRIATLAEARTELAEARHRAEFHRKRHERQIALMERGIASASKLEEIENDYRTATDRVAMARQKIQKVVASLGGDAEVAVDHHPLVRARIAAVERAELDLKRTIVRAPANGVVVSVPLVAGEHVAAGRPLFAIVTDAEPWVDANYKETDLTDVRVGQKARVVLDIYPGITWDAEVVSISPATGAEFAILPPQNASGNWVKVVQRLPVRLRLLPRPGAPTLRAGMTASVTIDTGRTRRLSDLLGSFTAFARSDAGARPSTAQW